MTRSSLCFAKENQLLRELFDQFPDIAREGAGNQVRIASCTFWGKSWLTLFTSNFGLG